MEKNIQSLGKVELKELLMNLKKTFLGEIPINSDVGKSGDKGKPIVEENPNHEISKIYLAFD